MSRTELTLLIHRLREMADEHARIEYEDDGADTADAHMAAMERETVLCAPLLREAIVALEAVHV